jgi:hypothetical protein
MANLICKECGDELVPMGNVETCKCGKTKHLLLNDTINLTDQLMGKVKDEDKVTNKFKVGASKSVDGSFAHIEQIVDKKNRWYKKKVTLSDGTVAKDVEGPLEDQSLHGPQKDI